MKIIKILNFTLAVIFIVSFSQNVFADCNSNSCNDVYVEVLYTNLNGSVYVGTTGDETVTTCNPLSGIYFQFDVSEPGGAAIYSTLLAAQTTNQKVRIRCVEGSAGELSYVILKKQ